MRRFCEAGMKECMSLLGFSPTMGIYRVPIRCRLVSLTKLE